MDESTVSFSALENALDYLRSAVLLLSDNPSRENLKYAVLHLAAGAEVIAKYRLQQHDWRLVLASNSEDTTYDEFRAGDFTSVSVLKAYERLKKRVGIDIGNDNLGRIKKLQKFRNQLQHFEIDATVAAVQGATVELLSFMLDFISEHVTPSVAPEDEAQYTEELEDLRLSVSQIQALVESRLRMIAEEIDRFPGVIVTCPLCERMTFAVSGQDSECIFCRQRWKPEDAASRYADNILGRSSYQAAHSGDPEPTEHCPECGSDAVVTGVDSRERDSLVLCFSCTAQFEDRCTRCGSVMTSSDGMVICLDCWDDVVRER